MKIWRRGHIGIQHKSFLESNSIKHETWYKVVMPPHPRTILDYMFEISEDDPAWPELKRRIGDEYLYVGTEFTDEERLNAEWCIMRGVHDLHAAGREWIQDYYADQCSKCGAGWRQTAPFRIKKEPNLGKNQFSSFGCFYLFCTPLVLDEFARQGISGFEAQPVILNKENRPTESLKQLVVTTIAEPAIAEELVEHERYSRNDCPLCGKTWHVHYTRGMLPLRKEALKPNVDFQLTNEWFGSGANARREILASQKVVRLILEKKWKGVEFVPIQVGESLAVTDFKTFDPAINIMEISTEENERLVSDICDSVSVALQKKEAVMTVIA
jgi:hypothetical protein